jgi:prepilin-type N-terminal cleavage/methylation domain-containing protein/prepilin-type processing-associated H-X9-DG protein
VRHAFTLIELLVVVAIIAILAAILFPVFAQAKLSAIKTRALAQSKQLATGLVMYASDDDDFFLPASMRQVGGSDPEVWPPKLLPYIKNKEIFVAPNSEGTFAENWLTRRNQSIGYNDATGVDPLSTAVPGAAPAGTEGFASAVSFSQAEESARTGLITFTPNSVGGKERGYVFNPYNGPNEPNGNYSLGLPLIADVNLCTTPYKGVDYSGRTPGALKPVFARYGGDGSGNGQAPVIFADGHARAYSASRMAVFGEIIWRFR